MTLSNDFKRTGNWLFRWRSYLPLLLVPFFIIVLRDFTYPYGSHSLDLLWEIFCLGVSFTGLTVRILTIGHVPFGTSGRNTATQSANVLNTTGMYSVVRHPLYLGNFLIWMGISLFVRIWWFSLIILFVFWLYYERIIYAEEEFLRQKFGEAFLDWALKTPAFIPDFKQWKSPALPFCIRTVLRREYSTYFAIIAVFTALEIIAASLVERRLVIDYLWLGLFLVSLTFYLVVRFIKKRTDWLKVSGR
ncbi:MAG: DUF1295 domain-containing protein [Deltaproteobacteria bacterium]|nr:DUF1295 domain-containing protein [Deltaproteobacteria bacterium]